MLQLTINKYSTDTHPSRLLQDRLQASPPHEILRNRAKGSHYSSDHLLESLNRIQASSDSSNGKNTNNFIENIGQDKSLDFKTQSTKSKLTVPSDQSSLYVSFMDSVEFDEASEGDTQISKRTPNFRESKNYQNIKVKLERHTLLTSIEGDLH